MDGFSSRLLFTASLWNSLVGIYSCLGLKSLLTQNKMSMSAIALFNRSILTTPVIMLMVTRD